MEPPPHGGGEWALNAATPVGQYAPQWSRPLTGAESVRPLTGAESAVRAATGAALREAAMEPPPHGGGERATAPESATPPKPQWSRPLTGAERPASTTPSPKGTLPQWSRPLTGAERPNDGPPLRWGGQAAMEPPPHGGGEGNSPATPGPPPSRRNGAAPSRGRRARLATGAGAAYRAWPQWSRPLTGAESLEPPDSFGFANLPQWSRPLTGAESEHDQPDDRRRDSAAAMEPPPHGGGE